jgi:hypothetical protein
MISHSFWAQHNSEIDRLHFRFASFRGVTKESIIAWLIQFESDEHAAIGLKLLGAVDYYNQMRVMSSFHVLHGMIESKLSRVERYYCGFGYSGESGSSLVREFRQAINESSDAYQSKYKHMNDVRNLNTESEVYFIMIDDVVGTGDQSRGYLETLKEILPDNVKLVLAPIVIPADTAYALESDYEVKIISPNYLDDTHKFFSNHYTLLTDAEKSVIKYYCEKAGEMPTGYGDAQLTVVFSTKIPDNTVSVLRCNNSRWRGLFTNEVSYF